MAKMMFDAAADSPGAWLFSGRSLKVASDRIDYRKSEESEQILLVHLEHVRKMLLGLAFEMILKGIVILEGKKLVTKHGLLSLVDKIAYTNVDISERDRDLLSNLEPFVMWAGRYPTPMKPDQYFVQVGSWDENDIAQALWDRLHEYVANNGWVMKMDGSRIPLRP